MLWPTITSASSCCSRASRNDSKPRSEVCDESTTDLVRRAAGLLAFSCAATASQPGGIETPSSRRTAEKWRMRLTSCSVAVGVAASRRTSRTYTTDALAISFTFKRWFTTVFRLSAATVSRGGSRLGASARGARTDLCAPATFTSSVHQDACDAEGTETAPLSASHEGPITRDFTIRCSSAPVCVPSAHTKDAPRVSAGSGAASAGYRTLSTYCAPRGISSRSKQ